jgi:acetyl-CoA carboxylase biotin carboxyl carrier protein
MAAAAGAPAPLAAPPTPTGEEDLLTVSSPIVGTYYESPSPGSPEFVKIGDTVEVGQVLCIIEAMKLMNEIEAETQGEVVRKLVTNGQPVEFGQPLLLLRPRK